MPIVFSLTQTLLLLMPPWNHSETNAVVIIIVVVLLLFPPFCICFWSRFAWNDQPSLRKKAWIGSLTERKGATDRTARTLLSKTIPVFSHSLPMQSNCILVTAVLSFPAPLTRKFIPDPEEWLVMNYLFKTCVSSGTHVTIRPDDQHRVWVRDDLTIIWGPDQLIRRKITSITANKRTAISLIHPMDSPPTHLLMSLFSFLTQTRFPRIWDPRLLPTLSDHFHGNQLQSQMIWTMKQLLFIMKKERGGRHF